MLTNDERREVAEIMRDGTRFSVSSCAVAPRLGLDCEEFETCAECESMLADRLADLIEPEPINGETSDGYHTFNELYHHRALLFSVVVRNYPELCWKSKKHHSGDMYEGMFIVGINTPDGKASYHYDIEPYWDMFECEELEFAPEWDGHTPDQAIERIGKLTRHEPEPERTCHMEFRKHGAIYDVFYFDCCDEEYAESRTDQYASGISGKVCPYCGAKVVGE